MKNFQNTCFKDHNDYKCVKDNINVLKEDKSNKDHETELLNYIIFRF